MADDGVREVTGVKAVRADDATKHLNIVVDETIHDKIRIGSLYSDVALTPPQARRLARQLYRFARRIEKRSEP